MIIVNYFTKKNMKIELKLHSQELEQVSMCLVILILDTDLFVEIPYWYKLYLWQKKKTISQILLL